MSKKQDKKSKKQDKKMGEKQDKQAKKEKGNENRPEEKTVKKPREDIRYIVRIAGKDLKGELPLHMALQGIKGIGHRTARNIAIVFEKETGKSFDTRLGTLGEEFDKKIEDIVLHPDKHNLPAWAFNRKRDFETGEDAHLIMADLDFATRKDLQRLNEIKSYRGLRLSWGLPVRGQRTKSTHRGKGPVVGVMKKDAKQGK